MAEITNGVGPYDFEFLMLPSGYIDQYNRFMTEYGQLSDREIFSNIIDVKHRVSPAVLDQHRENLDALSRMGGFVNNTTRQRIGLVQEALNYDVGSPNSQSSVETQFFGGSSLLLWFLTLAAIWRRPFYGFRGRF